MRSLLGLLVLGLAAALILILVTARLPGATTFNLLVLGTDQRPDERGDPGRTDSMMLVAVSRTGLGVSFVSIPRDLWVSIPGQGEGRINTVYRAGELAKAGSGAALVKRTVGEVLGVPVDRFLLVNMAGVSDLVNALGGIDLDIPETIIDDAYPTDDFLTTRITIPAGRQHLGGDLALAYARTRHVDSDYGRMRRQQQVISAIFARTLAPSTAQQLPALLAVLRRSAQTDLNPLDTIFLGPALVGVTGDRAQRLVIAPDLVTPFAGAGGASLLEPGPRLRPAVASFLNGSS